MKILRPTRDKMLNYLIDCKGYSEHDFDELSTKEIWTTFFDNTSRLELIAYTY